MNEYIKLKSVLNILYNVMSDDSIKHKGKAIRKRLKELPTVDVKRLRKLLDEEEKKNEIFAKQFYKAGVKDFEKRLIDKAEWWELGEGWEGDIIFANDVNDIAKELVGEG